VIDALVQYGGNFVKQKNYSITSFPTKSTLKQLTHIFTKDSGLLLNAKEGKYAKHITFVLVWNII